MFNNKDDVRILNGLIATTVDSVDGYRAAGVDASNERFRSIFSDRANEREDVVLELQTRVRELGGEPEDDGTALAGVHRVFMNLRDAVTGSDDAAVVSEVERGEDHIKAKFEAAMADSDLSAESQAVVRQCYASVKQGHDQMRDLKHGMTGETAR